MARGIARKSKRKAPKPNDERVADLTKVALDYLEAELDITVRTPGNAAEVMRIIKALTALRGNDGNNGLAGEDALRRNFSFVEDPEGN